MEIEVIRKQVEESFKKIDEYIQSILEERERLKKEFEEKLEKFKTFKFDLKPELLEEFLKEPYVLIPKKHDAYYVVVPKFVPMQIGWLEHSTRSYNIFVINRYTQWIYEVPLGIKKKLRMPEAPPFKVIDGYLYTGSKFQEDAWQKYRQFLLKREGKDRIKIRKGYEFELISNLIKDGCLPFTPQPVDKKDLRPYDGIELRSYQERAFKEFLRTGWIGVFWVFGSGKSLFGTYLCGRVKGRKLVVVPTLTLVDEWREKIAEYIPQHEHEIDLVTYHAFPKVKDREYTLVVWDEVHRLPANTFIRMASIRAKYRVGLSGTPFREDGREHLIFALTGFPVGQNWDEIREMGIVAIPKFKVYIVKDYHEKIRKLEELLKIPVKTIIFCDSIRLGQQISRKFGIPFVYGETKDRKKIIRESDTCIVSRVGDEGIHVPDLERVIEVAFLYGSRRQEAQRFGRLMHSQREEPEHVILMTGREYELYQKRLYPIYEKGFKIEIIR